MRRTLAAFALVWLAALAAAVPAEAGETPCATGDGADEGCARRPADSRAAPAPGVLLMQLKRPNVTKQVASASASAALGEEQARQPTTDEEIQSLKEQVQTLQGWLEGAFSALENKVGSCCCSGGSPEAGNNVSDNTFTTTPMPRPNLCSAFGDPHFITFDGAQTTLVGDMVIWLVKSQSVWIQGLSKESEGKLMGIAVSGPFLEGHTLVVYNATNGEPLQVLLDGQRILNESTSEYHLDGILDGYRTETWDPSKFNSEILNLRTKVQFDIGDFPTRFLGTPLSGLYLFSLPNGIDLTISGVDFMSAVIAMQQDPDGQGGYCGNFNGNPDDDAEPVVPSWDRPIGPDLDPVPEALNLFKSGGALSLMGLSSDFGHGKGQGRRHSEKEILKALDACKDDLLKQAEERCAVVKSKAFHRGCIFDICMTGKLEASDDLLTAEALQEQMNARGVPKFMGHGECLDSDGRRFRAFKTNLRTDEACQDVLRQLAATKGVLGAQLRRGHTCEILVERTTDPTGQLIPQGWVTEESQTAGSGDVDVVGGGPYFSLGSGLISQSNDDASWNCWQLN